MTTHASVLQRTLVLVRHSKASHDAPTDIERPLTPKGREMADVLARRLSGRLDAVDLLLVSPAARARQTADPEIYHNGALRILRLLTGLPEAAGTVILVGHEPTISIMAHVLHDADDDLASQVSVGVPTATALVLDVPGPWNGLGPGTAHLGDMLSIPR